MLDIRVHAIFYTNIALFTYYIETYGTSSAAGGASEEGLLRADVDAGVAVGGVGVGGALSEALGEGLFHPGDGELHLGGVLAGGGVLETDVVAVAADRDGLEDLACAARAAGGASEEGLLRADVDAQFGRRIEKGIFRIRLSTHYTLSFVINHSRKRTFIYTTLLIIL